MRDLAADHPIGRLLARHVVGIARIGGVRAGDELAGQELIWAGADRLGDLFEWIGLRDVLWHDEGDRCAATRDRVDEDRDRPFQSDLQRAVVLRTAFVDVLPHRLTDGLARCPALQTGRAVLCPNWLAVVEFQAVAQLDQIGPAVIGQCIAVGHLRAWLRTCRRCQTAGRRPPSRGSRSAARW